MKEVKAPPAKAREVFDYVKACAKDMRTVTYKEVANAVGLAPTGMAFPLGYIRDHICIERGLPWLNVIVVSSESHRPGDKFLPTSVDFGKDDELLWRGMVLQVFSYPSNTVSFD